jgi:hypothetical protein
MNRYIFLLTTLLSTNAFASDSHADVQYSFQQSMMREDPPIPTELANSAIQALRVKEVKREDILPTKRIFSLTEQQQIQLLLLKDEIGTALQEHDDFCGFFIRNSLSSSISKETYKDYFHYNPYKRFSNKISEEQWAYFYILQEKATERKFTSFCYHVIDKMIKNRECISEVSINAFHKEIEVALNQSAHSILESTEAFFNVDYPGLLMVQGHTLGLSGQGLSKYANDLTNNPQAKYLFELLYNQLSHIENYSLEQFEWKVMNSIKCNSNIITHIPILSAFNSTQLYLNLYKTISNIFDKEIPDNIFGRMERTTKNTSSTYMCMLSSNLDGQYNAIFRKSITQKEPISSQDLRLIKSLKGSKLDDLLKIKLTIDETKIQPYVSKIIATSVSSQFVNKNKVESPSLESKTSIQSLTSVTSQQEAKSSIPDVTISIKTTSETEIIPIDTNEIIDTAKSSSIENLDIILDSEEIVEEEFYVWNYEEWYRENVLKYMMTNAVQAPIVETTISNIVHVDRSNWSHNGNIFFDVVLGYCTYQPLKLLHFNSFLKDANGAKLKMTQRGYIEIKIEDTSVETKYALPNLTSSRFEQPYYIFTVHQPHPGHEFPRRTIFEFLRYQLQKAGYQ